MLLDIIMFIVGVVIARYVAKRFNPENQKPTIPELHYTLEKHGQTYYAFTINDQFITQATSLDVLVEKMVDKNPNTKFILAKASPEITQDLAKLLSEKENGQI